MATATRYSTTEVCALAGCSFRQLDYWCRIGLVRPSIAAGKGSGNRRAFSAHDAAVVRVISVIAGRTLPLNRLGHLAEFLDDLPLQQWAATAIILDEFGDVWRSGSDAPKIGLHVDLSLVFDEPATQAA